MTLQQSIGAGRDEKEKDAPIVREAAIVSLRGIEFKSSNDELYKNTIARLQQCVQDEKEPVTLRANACLTWCKTVLQLPESDAHKQQVLLNICILILRNLRNYPHLFILAYVRYSLR